MRILIGFLSLAVLLMAVVPASSDPGVTDTTVKVGMIGDLTGPVAFIGQEATAGARLYLQHVNDQGGVHGRKIDLIVEDDGYSPPRTIAAFRKLVDRDRIFCFAGNLGSPTTIATFPFVKRERIPLLFPLTANTVMTTPPKHYVFGLDPSYAMDSWIIVKYISEIQKAASPRLAVVYQDDDYGRDGLNGLRDAAAHYGLPIVAEESYKRGAVDLSTQVLNLKQADPTHVILWTVYREGAAVLKKAYHLNWHPQFIGGIGGADDKIVELAGEAAKGYRAIQVMDLWSDREQVRQYHRLIEQYDPGHRPGFFHALGFAIAQGLVEGLKRAGRDLTREKLVAAMETFNGWDGHLGAPITFGPNLRGGKNSAAFMVRADLEKKALVPDTDWIHIEIPTQVAQNGEE